MISKPYYRRFLLAFCASFIFVSCQKGHPQKELPPKSVDTVAFNAQAKVNYARGFRLTYHQNYKLLEILNPFQDQTDTLRYVLKPRGITLQQNFKNAQIIDIPVRSIIATSTTQIALTEMLGANTIIKGMVGAEYIYDKEISQRVERGEITSFSLGEFNIEQALALGPDLVMVSAGQSSQFDDYRVLIDSGISVLINSEWLETTPLGKAEWVKLMSALLNKEELANEKFSEIAHRYNQLKSSVQQVEKNPLVINNLPYKGAWFVSGGNSFTAQYLKDAGADYPWFKNPSTGGLRKSFEAVYEVGLRADVWLNPGAAASKAEILAKDERFKDFKSFKTGAIYNNNKRMSASGGNDFWESGVVHPDRLLADLIHILHPEILPDHSLYYYQKVGDDAR